MGAPIDAHHFLRWTIELQQTLAHLPALLDLMPDLMGGETSISFVDESSLETLAVLRISEALQPVLSVGGMG
ncbi:hypothetical protein PCA10_42690 [Metapseudomonas resinovorans NBRC 106553]|uniref:Uncharacterized protein n=1 Tax=Metapseudomonas resinovorans NBRC 106553 TaxID=1245471 RepID=S6AYU3_METRE|nr:hypothetical protein PCA10_42690 [Pseudomonas resinovorans NBRC 106553]